ncbi:hypothetical protein BGZ76_000406 [Entomortierella beljakovae]|nr:hypothetical protein BGZ76_000406 [Entomortierella beljakovae]
MGSKSNKKQKSGDVDSNKIISKEEEEEMSSALIAQLLAQEGGDDHGYYAEYNNDANFSSLGDGDYSDDDDDYRNDYNYRPKSRSKRGARHPRKKAKYAPTPQTTNPTASSVAAPKTPETTVVTANSGSEPLTAISTSEPSGAPIAASSDSTILSSTKASQPDNNSDLAATTTSATPETESSTAPTPVASTTAPAPAPPSATTTTPAPAAAPKAKKPKEQPVGMNSGVYSDVEEKAFVEALELFGRNWKSVEEHVATRDANSIRSHAQKHFIKLFRDNIPLPARVLETGPGYTLSGNDLDPYSAAARPYLSQRLLDDPNLLPAQGGTKFTPQSGALAKAERAHAKEKKVPDVTKESVKETVKEMKELRIRKLPKPTKERAESPPAEPVYVGRTDYSKARLRNMKERSSISFRQMAGDLDPLTMVKCEPFCGQPKSGVQGCQPFGIKVQSNVLLGMDFHAHLMTAEIIGFLAGEWNKSTRTIHIKAIFPCRSLQTGQNHVNVEMDPTSELEVRQEIEKRNMRIVGWYHSHPTFTPDPSLVDIENQTSYQSLFKDESVNEEPFVGAIVGPYDERLPGLSSVINWFYISHSPQERGHPKRLLYDLVEDTKLTEEEATSWTKLFDEYRDSPERTNFREQWRQDESETKLQKMLVSLGRRMPWLRNSLLKTIETTEPDVSELTESLEDVATSSSGLETKDEGVSENKSPQEAEAVLESQNIPEKQDTLDTQNIPESQDTSNVQNISDNQGSSDIQNIPETQSTSENHDILKDNGDTVGRENSVPENTLCPVEPLGATIEADAVVQQENSEMTQDVSEAENIEVDTEPIPEGVSSMEGIEPTGHDSFEGTMSSDNSHDHGLVRSLSNGSDSSSTNKLFSGVGRISNDPFLILVEQELSTWEEPVAC